MRGRCACIMLKRYSHFNYSDLVKTLVFMLANKVIIADTEEPQSKIKHLPTNIFIKLRKYFFNFKFSRHREILSHLMFYEPKYCRHFAKLYIRLTVQKCFLGTCLCLLYIFKNIHIHWNGYSVCMLYCIQSLRTKTYRVQQPNLIS